MIKRTYVYAFGLGIDFSPMDIHPTKSSWECLSYPDIYKCNKMILLSPNVETVFGSEWDACWDLVH